MKKDLVCQEEFDHNMWCVLPIVVGAIYRVDGFTSHQYLYRVPVPISTNLQFLRPTFFLYSFTGMYKNDSHFFKVMQGISGCR